MFHAIMFRLTQNPNKVDLPRKPDNIAKGLNTETGMGVGDAGALHGPEG